ncbi:hypothetical protein HPP92_028196, partial [Vanilla planifolia]
MVRWNQFSGSCRGWRERLGGRVGEGIRRRAEVVGGSWDRRARPSREDCEEKSGMSQAARWLEEEEGWGGTRWVEDDGRVRVLEQMVWGGRGSGEGVVEVRWELGDEFHAGLIPLMGFVVEKDVSPFARCGGCRRGRRLLSGSQHCRRQK